MSVGRVPADSQQRSGEELAAMEAAWLKLYENEGTPLDEAIPLSELDGEVCADHFIAGWDAARAYEIRKAVV